MKNVKTFFTSMHQTWSHPWSHPIPHIPWPVVLARFPFPLLSRLSQRPASESGTVSLFGEQRHDAQIENPDFMRF